MRSRELVSVVIPCYNPVQFLHETLASVRAQTYRPIETILVDDGTDNPAGRELLGSVASEVTRFIQQPNLGLAAARNAGFAAAAGTYVLPLDGDDRIKPSFIAESVAALKKDSEAAFAYADYHVFGDIEKTERLGDYNLADLLDRNTLCYASLIRRADWERAGGYDPSMRLGYEDWDFWLRLAEHGRFGRHLDRVLFEYRKHGRSLYSVALEHHQELVKKIRNNHPQLFSHEGRLRIKRQWDPAVCLLGARAAVPGESGQTLLDVQEAPQQDPKAALAASKAPVFLAPAEGRPLARQSAELAALAVWSGKPSLRLPDGARAVSRSALAAPRGWFGRLFGNKRAGPAGHAAAPRPLRYITPPKQRVRIALIGPDLGAAACEQFLSRVAKAIDRDACELLAISTESGGSSGLDCWAQAADHVYELAPFVSSERLVESLYWMAVNWELDAIVIENSAAAYSVVPFLRENLPAIWILELVPALAPSWGRGSALLSSLCQSDLRVVVSEAGWRALENEEPAAQGRLIREAACLDWLEGKGERAAFTKTVLFDGERLADVSAAEDRFFRGGASGASDLPKVEINFGNVLQVPGVRLWERQGLFRLEIHWRCLNPVAAPLRCFAHVTDREGNLLGSMDHDILRGKPPLGEWQPADEGHETRYLALPESASAGARLRLGLFDSETGMRVPVWTSTVALADYYTAIVIDPNREPGADLVFEMSPAPIEPCDVKFEQGLRLTGYSLRRAAKVAWLRLEWSSPSRPNSDLRFFGHVTAEQSADAPILSSFDQSLEPGRMVQDIVRDVAQLGGEARFLRAGIFNSRFPDRRLAIRASSLPFSKQERALYLPFPQPEPARMAEACRSF